VPNQPDHSECQQQIASLTRENATLRIQLLTVTQDLAHLVFILNDGDKGSDNGAE